MVMLCYAAIVYNDAIKKKKKTHPGVVQVLVQVLQVLLMGKVAEWKMCTFDRRKDAILSLFKWFKLPTFTSL